MDQKSIIAIVAVAIAAIAVIAAAFVVMNNNGGSDNSDETVSVSGIYLNKAEISLDIGGTATITCTVSPTGAADKTVTWASSDSSVATVNNGVVKGIAAGSAVITATTNDGGYAASCKVTVAAEPEIKYDMTVYDVDDCNLVVYGNANNDDTIDETDRAIIQSYVEGTSTWVESLAPFADTNADGKVDENDLVLLDSIINKTPCTVYFPDYVGDIMSCDYPITGDVGTMYWEAAQMAVILDIWDDRVTACGQRSMNDLSYPGYESKFHLGDGYNVDPQTVLQSGVGTLICYTGGGTTIPAIKELVAATGTDLNILSINMQQSLRCIVTYGFLFDTIDKSTRYLELADKCSENIETSMKDVATEDQPSVAIVILYGTATTENISVLGYNAPNNTNQLAYLMYSVPNVNWIRADLDLPAYRTQVTSEWFITNQPDYIVVAGSTGLAATTDSTKEEVYQAYYDKCEEIFGQTNAFKNGHIVATANGTMGGSYGPLKGLEILSHIYPQIDSELAEEAFNAAFFEFSKMDSIPYNQDVFYVGESLTVDTCGL